MENNNNNLPNINNYKDLMMFRTMKILDINSKPLNNNANKLNNNANKLNFNNNTRAINRINNAYNVKPNFLNNNSSKLNFNNPKENFNNNENKNNKDQIINETKRILNIKSNSLNTIKPKDFNNNSNKLNFNNPKENFNNNENKNNKDQIINETKRILNIKSKSSNIIKPKDFNIKPKFLNIKPKDFNNNANKLNFNKLKENFKNNFSTDLKNSYENCLKKIYESKRNKKAAREEEKEDIKSKFTEYDFLKLIRDDFEKYFFINQQAISLCERLDSGEVLIDLIKSVEDTRDKLLTYYEKLISENRFEEKYKEPFKLYMDYLIDLKYEILDYEEKEKAINEFMDNEDKTVGNLKGETDRAIKFLKFQRKYINQRINIIYKNIKVIFDKQLQIFEIDKYFENEKNKGKEEKEIKEKLSDAHAFFGEIQALRREVKELCKRLQIGDIPLIHKLASDAKRSIDDYLDYLNNCDANGRLGIDFLKKVEAKYIEPFIFYVRNFVNLKYEILKYEKKINAANKILEEVNRTTKERNEAKDYIKKEKESIEEKIAKNYEEIKEVFKRNV